MPSSNTANESAMTTAVAPTTTTKQQQPDATADPLLGTRSGMWNAGEIASYYGNYAQRYDSEIDSDRTLYPGPFKIGSWAIEWLMNSQLEATRRNYQFRTGTESTTAPATSASFKSLRVLDLGCGTGQSCQPFIDHAAADKTYHYELVGLDTTQEMLDKAAERKFDTLVKHDLEAYPYPTTLKPATFDAVVCVGVMDFIRDPRAFMVHARSFMKPARTAVVGAVNGKNAGAGASATTAAATSAASFDMSLPASVLGITIPERHPHSDLSSFSRAEMETLFRETGFLVERHERFMGYFDSNSGLVQYYHGWLCTMDEGEK